MDELKWRVIGACVKPEAPRTSLADATQNPISCHEYLGGHAISILESDSEPPIAVDEPAIAPDATPQVERRARKPRGKIITIVLLSLAIATAVAFIALYSIKLAEANSVIEKQEQQIKKQQNLIDKKETFGAAMNGLMGSAKKFDGILTASIIPFDEYEADARQGWLDRWDSSALTRDTTTVRTAVQHLEVLRSTASTQAATNDTGTKYEAVIDQLGGGFVSSKIDDAHSLCESDALACVISDDPYTVHFDVTDNSAPYMNDWLRSGVAYHEFAHVLQFTNPVPTKTALASFGDNTETMADCFALTYLDGWTLDHRVWVGHYTYWDVSIGYGYTCNDTQKQAVREWYSALGFHTHPISQ